MYNFNYSCRNHFLGALLCSVYLFVYIPYCSTNMCLFDRHTVSSYDLHSKLDLPCCDYLTVGEDNIDMLSTMPMDLKILQLNIRGLLNKQDHLKMIMQENNVDVALLCETWLNDKTDKLLKIPNYKNYNKNRPDKIGGCQYHG